MLGFAMRAGKVVIGCDGVVSALQSKGKNAVKLVIVSFEASEATQKKIKFKCEFYYKPLIKIDLESAELGRLLGKLYAPAVVAITDEGFAKEILLAHEKMSAPSEDKNQKRKEVSVSETGDTYAPDLGKDYSNL